MFVIPLTTSWLVSKTADRIYLVCALSSLILFGMELGLSMAAAALDEHALKASVTFVVFYRLIQVSVPGTALLWIAMWLHWIKFNIGKRGYWLLGLMLGPVGSVFYYFFVYRKQTRQILSEVVLVTTPAATNP